MGIVLIFSPYSPTQDIVQAQTCPPESSLSNANTKAADEVTKFEQAVASYNQALLTDAQNPSENPFSTTSQLLRSAKTNLNNQQQVAQEAMIASYRQLSEWAIAGCDDNVYQIQKKALIVASTRYDAAVDKAVQGLGPAVDLPVKDLESINPNTIYKMSFGGVGRLPSSSSLDASNPDAARARVALSEAAASKLGSSKSCKECKNTIKGDGNPFNPIDDLLIGLCCLLNGILESMKTLMQDVARAIIGGLDQL